MPRDSSGNYTLPAGNPVVANTVITSNWANDTMSDLGNEMTNSLSRDGEGGMNAALQFIDGAAITPSFTFVQEPTLGFYRSATQVFNAVAANTELARFSLTNQLEVFRDNGGGFEWFPVLDSGSSVDEWSTHLDGYLDTGLHGDYVGDLNDIVVNSNYSILDSAVTNAPSDFAGDGFITSDIWSGGIAAITQTLVGLNDTSVYKIWLRHKVSSVWGAWKLVVDGNAIEIAANGDVTVAGSFFDVSTHRLSVGDGTNTTAAMRVNGAAGGGGPFIGIDLAGALKAFFQWEDTDVLKIASDLGMDFYPSNVLKFSLAADGTATFLAPIVTDDGTNPKTEQQFLRTGDRLDITNVRTS